MSLGSAKYNLGATAHMTLSLREAEEPSFR